jgi:hypothetical protein
MKGNKKERDSLTLLGGFVVRRYFSLFRLGFLVGWCMGGFKERVFF